MNPVLILTRNCLELTKRAIDSVLAQDIPASVHVIDNGSSDGTLAWLEENGYLLDAAKFNAGVSVGWNHGLGKLLPLYPHVLVINNDIVLAPWAYRKLLEYQKPFITGVATDRIEETRQPELPIMPIENHPDFSMFLITREAWIRIGEFDESMKLYASDCDYHVRGFRIGIPMVKACVPFYHERSSTARHACPEEQRQICLQADADRKVFRSKYGCEIGTPEYDKLFS